jgi:hypothetical protein
VSGTVVKPGFTIWFIFLAERLHFVILIVTTVVLQGWARSDRTGQGISPVREARSRSETGARRDGSHLGLAIEMKRA